MIWIAPTEKDTAATTLEQRLRNTADQFRANSGLKAQEDSDPILGIIFLRLAEVGRASSRASGHPSTLNHQPSTINSRRYRDVPGLCKVGTLKEIEAQGSSLLHNCTARSRLI